MTDLEAERVREIRAVLGKDLHRFIRAAIEDHDPEHSGESIAWFEDTLLTELKRLREAHRHCWHDNANYLCEGETCGDALQENE